MPTIEIFLAVFIFILIVLISIEDILTGFLLLMLLMPLQHKELFSLVMWDVLPVRIAFFGILLTTFYRSYLWYRRYKKKELVLNFVRDPVLILLGILYLIRLLSIIFVAEDKIAGLKLLAFYTTIVYFYLLAKFLYTKYRFAFLNKALLVYSLIGSITGLIAVIQYFAFTFYEIKFGAIWDIPTHAPRVGSTFWDVNHFAAFISSVIPISASYFLLKKGYSRIFWVFNTFFLCGVLYITQSRSSWLGLAVGAGLFVYFLFIKGFKQYAKAISVIGIVGLVSILSYFQFLGPGVMQKYKSFMHTRLDSFDTHFILLEGAMEVYRDNPIIGKGYGNFNEAFRKTSFSDEYFFRERNIVNQRVPSHSIWGEIAAETGFLGIAAYVLLFFTIIAYPLYGFVKSKSHESFLALGVSIGVISLLVSGIFYTYNLEFYWMLAFLSACTGYYFAKDISPSQLLNNLSKIKSLPLIFVTSFSSFFLFWDLGKNKLIDWDEAIYAAVSKNMYLSGDFLTPQWTLGVPWFEKPPLYFWFSSFFMNIFGAEELAARLPSAIFSLGTVILTYYFGKLLFKSRQVGFVASLMLVTTGHYLYYSRMSMIDVSVTFFITLSLYFGYKFFNSQGLKNKYIIYSGIACGLAVLTKSIVGLLPLGIIAVYGILLVLKKDIPIKKYLTSGIWFFAVSFLVAAPWHIIMYVLHGQQFIDTYFITHILSRGLTDQQGKFRPFFWYIEVIKVSFRVWFLILIPGLLLSIYNTLIKRKAAFQFLLLSILVIFLFFSASNSKLIWYIIPIYPLLSLVSAYTLVKSLDLLKKYNFDRLISPFNLRAVFSVVFPLLLLVYFLDFHKLVYYPDFNRDLVKVIEIYNERKADPNMTLGPLYYLRISSPVMMFYTNGGPIQSDLEPLEKLVKAGEFNTSFIYVSRMGEVKYFEQLLGGDRVKVTYSSGAYHLTLIKSPEDYTNDLIFNLQGEISGKINLYPESNDKKEQVEEIVALQKELYSLEEYRYEQDPEKYTPPIKVYFDGIVY